MFLLTHVDTYDNLKSPKVVSTTSITNWFTSITNVSSYSERIIKARNGELDYNKTKESLPCVTYNFNFNLYKTNDNIINSTGLLYLDIDNQYFDISKIDKSKVYSYYKSFGGKGYAIIVKVDGLNLTNFNSTYNHISNDLGISKYIDTNAKKASQYNVLSYDPDLFLNENSFIYKVINTPQSNVIKKERAYTLDWGEDYIKKDKIRFDDLDKVEIPYCDDYIVNWTGIQIIKCWIPIKKKKNNRNNTLLSYANNLVWLNPDISKEKAFEILNKVNQIAFYEPVDNNQLRRVIDSIFGYLNDGTLTPIIYRKKRKIIFDKNTKLSGDDKKAIVIGELAKMKSSQSQQKLYNILEVWNFEKFGKITQTKIYKNFPISKKTVEKYWGVFKEYIKDLNE